MQENIMQEKGQRKQQVTLENNILKVQTLLISDNIEAEPEILDEKSIPLSEITEKDIYGLRKEKKPAFILKKEGKYFYSLIPKELKVSGQNILGEHCCSKNASDCKYLYASTGGCPKVRDLSNEYYERMCNCKREYAIMLSKRIEKYSFIALGYETINTIDDSLVVVECKKYESSRKSKK